MTDVKEDHVTRMRLEWIINVSPDVNEGEAIYSWKFDGMMQQKSRANF